MSGLAARIERWLLLFTPAAALAVVAMGLRLGAPSVVRAAIVYGAPVSTAGTGLAWQVVVFEDDQRVRQPVSSLTLDVTAQSGAGSTRVRGVTNDDGVAELLLRLASGDGVSLDVRAGGALLAGGEVSRPLAAQVALPVPAW
ncbi:MAG: hypothetical protein M3O50_19500, partial [Myxococcota bacterium]|nr:hypothetical protein [Myxococcota bacterium]